MLLLSKNSNCVHRNMALVGEFYENEDYRLHRDSVERIYTETEVRALIAEALEQLNQCPTVKESVQHAHKRCEQSG